MPHISIKLYPGRPEELKQKLSDAVAQQVMSVLQCGEESVSVAIEDVRPQDWKEQVYRPDILDKQDKIYKQPGYQVD